MWSAAGRKTARRSLARLTARELDSAAYKRSARVPLGAPVGPLSAIGVVAAYQQQRRSPTVCRGSRAIQAHALWYRVSFPASSIE